MKIVVLASPRTGSTALSDFFGKIYKCENFQEFFHAKSQDNFINFPITGKKSWVVKFMPDQIVEPYFSMILANSDKIYGITRKDQVAQIASFFIAVKSNKFHFKRKQPKFFNTIEFRPYELEQCIDFILNQNQKYNQLLKPLCSVEYIYEHSKNFLNISELRESDRPSNYQDIIDSIKKYLDSQSVIL